MSMSMSMSGRARPAAFVPRDPVHDASVWGRDDFPEDRRWAVPIPDALIDELDALLPALRTAARHPRDLRREHSPLPRSAEFIASMRDAIEFAPGFVLMTGFPVHRYARDDLVRIYCALGVHFGHIAIQNRIGEYVVEVSDRGRGLGPQARGHYGNRSLPFHADGANAVSLLCTETAPEGGLSLLVSGPAIYNAVVAERPDLLPVLERGFHHHRRDEREEGDAPVTPWRTPVFAYYDNLFHIIYIRPSIDYCVNEGVVLTDREIEALDFVDSVIERPAMQVSMSLQPGDVQIVNNFLVLHSRTGYRDSPTQQRCLIRLWLDDPDSIRNGPGKMDWYMPEHSRFLRDRGALLEGYTAGR
jgi:hypothetical protein